MALNDVVNHFKQLRRNTTWFLNYFKYSLLLSMIKGVPACAFSKCTHCSLFRPFAEKLTGTKLSICSVALYYLMSTAILLADTESAISGRDER